MKMIKTILAATVFSAGLGLTGLGLTAATAEIRLGLDSAPYPPFADVDASGKRTGFEIELGEALCKAMKETCVWTPIAWDGIIPALNSKKIDAIFASMSITEKTHESDFLFRQILQYAGRSCCSKRQQDH